MSHLQNGVTSEGSRCGAMFSVYIEGVAGWALGPVAVRGGDAGGLVPTHEPEGGSPESEPCALANRRQLGSALEHLLIYLVPEHVCY